MTKTLTIRLSTEALEDLERLAHSTKRSKAFLAAQAVAEFVANQKWQVGALEEARAQIFRGETVSAGEVKAWLQTWGTGHTSQAPHSRRGAGRTTPST
jgi:predicted transcriptional regulator